MNLLQGFPQSYVVFSENVSEIIAFNLLSSPICQIFQIQSASPSICSGSAPVRVDAVDFVSFLSLGEAS